MMLPTLIIFFVLMISTNKMNEYQNSILLENVTSITAASNLENSLLRMRGLKAYYLLDGNMGWIEEFNTNMESFNFWYQECFDSAYSGEEHDILSTMSVDFANYMTIHEKIIKAADDGHKGKARELLLFDSNNSFDDIFNGCEKLIKKNQQIIAETEKKLHKYTKLSKILAYITLVCFFIFGILLIFIITKSIVGPIKEIEQASRDFIPEKNKRNEIEMLKERFEMMIKTINDNQRKLIISERRAAIGEIAAGISHELNNPIGVIYGFAQVLISRSQITENDREFIEDIFRESERCKILLKDLLDFARTPEPNYMETDIINLTDETINLIKNQTKYEKIVFEIINSSSSKNAFVDPFQIKQVLFNLLINSCDAMNKKGTITLQIDNHENSLQISVKDHGAGIKTEEMEKIFTPFFTTKDEGVGLGLAVCRDIITKHNGTITVRGKQKEGAEFIIDIPAGENEKA
jgi:signal transduction histidine kinase